MTEQPVVEGGAGPGRQGLGYGVWAAIALAVLAAAAVLYLQAAPAGKGGTAALSAPVAALQGLFN